MKPSFRLLAGLVAILALTTACSDATGRAAAKRSGYITSSSAIISTGTTTKSDTAQVPLTGVKKGGVEPQNSGYNVTAF